MPIDRKDRSFDRIFDEVDVHNVPSKFVMMVKIILHSGETIEVRDLDEASALIHHISQEEVADVQISLDYDKIKNHVTGEVKSVLSTHFKGSDE